ncbi:hypothetical protein CCACVL1_13040 [Corchorus capsularis]|uniref:Uncharacterized protein n=1 Tax=Corchorus capsularis TaxID=210143 RepID=A0A1R3ICT7_COCAP|nr:hypothetical protein CCACVL1_13040 [Corchorus capsularis]
MAELLHGLSALVKLQLLATALLQSRATAKKTRNRVAVRVLKGN